MIKKIIGFILILWGGALLFKNLFVHPTIFTQIKYYGLTAYMAGQLFALIIAVLMITFGMKWLFRPSKNRLQEG